MKLNRKVNVGLCQFSASEDKDRNAAKILKQAKQAKQQFADIAVFPENAMFASKEGDLESKSTNSEFLDGEFVNKIKNAAKDCSVGIVVGMLEKNTEGKRPYNTVIYVDAKGGLVSSYRKVHLYDAFGYKESDTIRPAETAEPLVFDVNGISFGVMTCYDLRFPEMARMLVDAGADALLLPAAWLAGPRKETHWEILLKARAIENTVYVAGVGQTKPKYTGCSMLVDPMGISCCNLGEENGVATALVAASRIESVRKTNPSLLNRKLNV